MVISSPSLAGFGFGSMRLGTLEIRVFAIKEAPVRMDAVPHAHRFVLPALLLLAGCADGSDSWYREARRQ